MPEQPSRLLTGVELLHSHEVGESACPAPPQPLLFFIGRSLSFLFSHPYSLFLHIYISLVSEVCCSLILRLRPLPRGPESGPLAQAGGLRDRPSQPKIPDNLDSSARGRRLHQADLEVRVIKTDARARFAHEQIRMRPTKQLTPFSDIILTYLLGNGVSCE